MISTRNAHPACDARTRQGHVAVLMVLILTLLGAAATSGGQAAEKTTTIISIGESNSDPQRQELLGYFAADSDAKVDVITVQDTKDAMQDVIPGFSLSSAFSSAALTCRQLGDGLDVSTINITQITPAMFAMALVTAGVGDATLIVAAPASAPAQGMTALTGIFKAWDALSCDSAQTTTKRQQLALRELALTVEISTAIGESQTGYAGAFVIDTQRNIVTNKYTSRDEITSAIVQQEGVYGFTVPEPSRTKLIDLMVDLTKEKIDWSTFSAGWTIEYPTGTSIQMRGDGIAIQNAQASATAKAAKEQTRVAREQTAAAKAAKEMTQTAVAADKTATALAQPTPTATPTPLPNEYAGVLTGPVEDQRLNVKYADGTEAAYQIASTVAITRDAEAATTDDLKKGDSVNIKVDAMTDEVVEIVATAPEKSGTPLAKLIFLLPVLLLIPLGMVVKGRAGGDPFVVKRVARD
jgi:uncharacterized protein YpuA (DUF1002 family)